MARKVFENSMVAHVWAQGNQDEGRSNNGQLYFVGPVIYSYGSHFVAGVIDNAGRYWTNADSYSPTTAKHMSYVRRAVPGRAFSVPSLTGIYRAIQALGDKSRAAWVKRELESYLAKNWRAFPADSEAGAALWAGVSPRGAWANEYARRDAKAAKEAARNAKAAARHAIAHAKEVAAIPLDMVRLRMIQSATNATDWSKERDLKAAVAFYQDAHRGSAPGPVRVALWARVKLAKELAARFLKLSGKANAERRGAIATLRRIWAGDYGASGALNYAIAERQNLDKALKGFVPAALREKAAERGAWLATEIDRLEREKAALAYAEMQADCDAWRAGERVTGSRYALRSEGGGALIRATGVEMDGCAVISGTLETSQGATVPLRHAARVFAFVRAIRERGEEWQGNRAAPVRVGHFTLDSVKASGDFVAGCHVINWSETERLARELGLWDCPATALVSNDETESA
jgi:hypothetical protein